MDLELDVAQWRREIRVFAETTAGELQAILEALSANLHPHRARAGVDDVDEITSAGAGSDRREPTGDDRLAAIRRQLAERIEASATAAEIPGAIR